MAFVVGDDSGLCKECWLSENIQRIRIIKKAKQSRTLSVTCLCWSGPPGGKEFSEIAVGRSCGTVEAFPTSSIVCEAPLSATAACGDNLLDVPLRSFQLPSTPVALSLIGSEAARAYTRSLLCKEWLGNDVSQGVAYLREALQSTATSTAAEPNHDTAGSSSLLLAVGQKGHACVVQWEGSFSARLIERASEAEEHVVPLSGIPASEQLTDVPIKFRPIGSEHTGGTDALHRVTLSDPFCCRAAYLLPGPVATASSHPLCRSLLAFGGRENDAKVVDLDYGKSIWTAKNVKPSFLGLRCEVAVTQIDWLLSVHPMILVVGNAKGTLRFYDMRCQRRPILEVCKATQEKRPVTSLCVRPTAELLKTQTDLRIALARAAEVATFSPSSKLTEQPEESTEATHVRLPAAEEGPGRSFTSHSVEVREAATLGQALLGSCSGKESATVYYGDSCGMVYGLRVMSGATLLRLADKTCPKFNPSSYRSLDDRQNKAERSPESRRRLIFAMLENQRQRLSSKKNDHPMAIAACTELQLAAVPVGGFKGAMGAIVSLALDPTGERLIAVGMGRYAYLFDAKSRKLCGQAFLKQKLTFVLPAGGAAAGGVRLYTGPKQQLTSKGISADKPDHEDGQKLDSECHQAVERQTLVGSDESDTEDSAQTSVEPASRGNVKSAGPSRVPLMCSQRSKTSKRKATSGEKSQRQKLRC